MRRLRPQAQEPQTGCTSVAGLSGGQWATYDVSLLPGSRVTGWTGRWRCPINNRNAGTQFMSFQWRSGAGCTVHRQSSQHTSKVFGRADDREDPHRQSERSEAGLRVDLPFDSHGADERCLVLRWRAPFGNSRASPSPNRQTESRSRIFSTPSPSRSARGIAGAIPILHRRIRTLDFHLTPRPDCVSLKWP